ncbi:MAG TPA: hypothetical protein VLS45_09830, partial [Methylomicrobium sp.]|nr:hypothetical protein [Methylomicrobium sp.]
MIISREAVMALMPHQTLTKIIGEPTHAATKKLERELAANLIAVDCSWGINRGHLGELLPAAIFIARYGAPYIPPAAAPPTYPIVPHGTTAAGHEALKATNEEEQKAWQTLIHVRRIVVNQAAKAIEKVYYAELEDPIEGLNGVEIRDLIDHIRSRYCHIDQADLDANLERFNQGIDPSVPLIVYIHKQEDCQEFAIDGHVPISEETMVTVGTKHALQCGAFTEAWKEWNRVARINQTWAAWKNHWTRVFEEQRTIQCITGGGFTANSALTKQEDELAEQMVNSLDNLALAAIQKNETLEKLIEMNNQKGKIIASLTEHLKAEKVIQTKLLQLIG